MTAKRIYIDKESTPEERAAMTVGALRKLLEGMPDDAPIFPNWANDDVVPHDNEPGVEIHGFAVDGTSLAVLVSLFYLEEEDEEIEVVAELVKCSMCGKVGALTDDTMERWERGYHLTEAAAAHGVSSQYVTKPVCGDCTSLHLSIHPVSGDVFIKPETAAAQAAIAAVNA